MPIVFRKCHLPSRIDLRQIINLLFFDVGDITKLFIQLWFELLDNDEVPTALRHLQASFSNVRQHAPYFIYYFLRNITSSSSFVSQSNLHLIK